MVDAMLRRRRECLYCKHRFSTYEIDDGCIKLVKKYTVAHGKAVAKTVARTRRNEKIIEQLKQGFKHSAIAAEFGLSDNMISTIARQHGLPSFRKQRMKK